MSLRNIRIISGIGIRKYSFPSCEQNLRNQLPNSDSAPLKQSTLKCWNQIFPKKVFWRRNLGKQLSNSESAFETKHFKGSGPNPSKKGILGRKFN